MLIIIKIGDYRFLFASPNLQPHYHNAQCSKWYEISDMDIFQITEENPDPPTKQGAYFNILLSI